MSEIEINRFETLLCKTKFYLEYGSGGSTIMAYRSFVNNIISIESDKKWADAVRKKTNDEDCRVIHIDIGKVDKWGSPRNDKKWKRYAHYALEPWKHIEGDTPELILIDGRFRVACFLACLIFSRIDTHILVHDYKKRDNYKIIEKYVPALRIIDSMAEFVIPQYVNTNDLWIEFVNAITDPR
jgi:hypothetical protein